MPDNFFAMLNDHTVRRIVLLQAIEPTIGEIFVSLGAALTDEKEEVIFDGNYKIDVDEILYVTMTLPEELSEVANNPIGIPILNLEADQIRALLWYEGEEYYFQNFDHRKLLSHKNVLFYDNQTFNRLTQDAFVIDNVVNAVYKDGKFYFQSYSNANKIFSLREFYEEATNEGLTEFGEHDNVSIGDQEWFLENANTVIRKHVTLLQKSNLLDDVDTKKIRRSARKFNVPIQLDREGRILFPRDMKVCKRILYYLNEQYYEGPITRTQFATNSKKPINNGEQNAT